MTVFIIGGGGREHAIAWKLKKDDGRTKIIAAPGNGGISNFAECMDMDIGNTERLADFAACRQADYTIVGPEAPLASGIADIFEKKGLKVFGPRKQASKLECSKVFAKEFMSKYNIPTAGFQIACSYKEGMQILEKRKYPCVLKYDGLAAGKGVKVVEDKQNASSFLHDIYTGKLFGGGSKKVLVEDCLEGKELSYLVFTDTDSFVPMVPAKDHKRVFDGDKGPNTGGMGCYSPPCFFDRKLEEVINQKIVEPTLLGLQKEGIDYRGVLYFGLILTEEGPYVLEYNVRFGDPETQAILPRMESPLLDAIDAVIEKKLDAAEIKWSGRKSICVVLASGGYPGEYMKGKTISGLDSVEDVVVFHAGTDRKDEKIITSGGRVLGVTAVDSTLEKAREKVYKAVSVIDFEGKYYRKDIGTDIRNI